MYNLDTLKTNHFRHYILETAAASSRTISDAKSDARWSLPGVDALDLEQRQ